MPAKYIKDSFYHQKRKNFGEGRREQREERYIVEKRGRKKGVCERKDVSEIAR